MPEFTEQFEISGPKGKKTGSAFVDTGASFTVVPKPTAEELGLQPYRQETVDTNNGPVQWGVARADVSVGGRPARNQDVFVAPAQNPLAIGAASLQASGFQLRAMSARARQSICMGCEAMQLHPYLGPKCTACGCLPPGDLIAVKTRLPGSRCPKGYW